MESFYLIPISSLSALLSLLLIAFLLEQRHNFQKGKTAAGFKRPSDPESYGLNKAVFSLARNCTSLIVALLLFWGHGAQAQSSQTFNTSGTFTVPAGVTCVKVEAWGGGGSGGSGEGTNNSRGGGGGGAYASSFLTVAPGSITVTVGAGGIRTTSNNDAGSNGGPTSFGGLVIAAGGTAGDNNGGLGGTIAASTGTIKFAGGGGGNRFNNGAGGGGGGSAFFNANGNNGINGGNTTGGAGGTGTGTGGNGGNDGASGSVGNTPGGGGGGKGDAGNASGNGAAGRVIVTWVNATNFSTSIASPICFNNAATITINSTTLAAGTYTVTYNLSGSNTATGNTASMVFSGTSGTFATAVLPNSGSTTITITNITFTGWTCTKALSSGNTAVITVQDNPTVNAGAGLTAICQGSTSANLGGSVGASATGGTWSTLSGGTFNPNANTLNATWTPPALFSGTATLTLTTSGSACAQVAAAKSQVVNPAPIANINYAGSPFCNTLVSPQAVTLSGTSGGGFSAPAGLSLNGVTGEITPSLSTPGSYTVTYSFSNGTCSNTTTATVVITALPTAGFSYTASPYCTNAVNPLPTLAAGAVAGVFSATPAGLNFSNASTGLINLSASAANTYTVTNTVAPANGCGVVTATNTVVIAPLPTAAIAYASAAFCNNISTTQYPLQTGTAGGTYSAPAGLNLNAADGGIDPSTSTPAVYTVTYSFSDGTCSSITTTSVTITALPVATFSYLSSPYCKTASNPSPTFGVGGAAGVFSSIPAGLNFVSTATGVINLSTSAAGTYTITNTRAAAGGCAVVTATSTVTITALPLATFSCTGSPYCSNAVNPTPTLSGGAVAGTFSSTVGLVFISTATGQVDIASSTPGTYTVTNTIAAAGGCGVVTATSNITITALPVATFSYVGSPYCKTASNPSPTFGVGGAAGVFSSTPAGLNFVSTATGVINLTTSAAGTYTITNTRAAAGGCAVVTATSTVTITALPVATFSYTGSPYCSNAVNPTPTFSGGAVGGTFSSTVGLVFISTATGQVDIASSTPGTYTVTNTIAAAGGCGVVTATSNITITALPVATFSYVSSPYCKTATNPSPTFGVGGAAGVFSSTPAGLNFVSTATGVINLSTSAAGTYTITNTRAAAGGCAVVTATSTVTITALPVATFSYTGSPYCSNAVNPTPTLSGGAVAGTFSSTAGLVFISNATGQVDIASSTPGIYTVTNTIAAAGGCGVVTATSSITINPVLPVSVSISPSANPICAGTSVTFTATPTNGGATPAYQWKLNGINVGTNTSTYTNSTLANGNTITCTLTSNATCPLGSPAVSSTVTMTVNPQPAATIAGTVTVCQNNTPPNILFTGSAGTAPYTFIYKINGGADQSITTTIGNTVNVPAPTTATGTFTYTLVSVQDASSTACLKPQAGTATVTVHQPAAIVTQPLVTQTVCSGNSVSFSVVANGTGLSYQWRKGLVNLSNGGSISGATTSTLTINPITVGAAATDYNVVITPTAPCVPIVSNDAALVVNQQISIVTQPLPSQTLCSGSIASFSVTATGTGLTYQWWKNGSPLLNGGNVSGANTDNLLLSNISSSDAANYTVVITGVNPCSPLTSTIAALSVNTSVSITSGPTDVALCGSLPASFSVSATGSGLTYQWYKGSFPGTALVDNANISGATTATLNFAQAFPSDEDDYYVIVSGLTPCASEQSDYGHLTVSQNITVLAQPAAQSICLGSPVTFSVTADAAGDPITYQWRKNALPILGETAATFSIGAVAAIDAASYDVVITGPVGYACPTSFSIPATLTVSPTTVGGTVTTSSTVCSGTNAGTLSLTGQTGSVVGWEVSTDAGVTWSAIANTTTTQSYTNLVQASDYRAVVKSSVCPLASAAPATISLYPVSVGGTVSGSATVCSGTNSGTLSLSGQTGTVVRWEFSINAGSTWTTIANTGLTQNYNNLTQNTLYRAVVQSGTCAAATSVPASITVTAVSVGGTVTSNAAVCSGTNGATLTLSGYTGSVVRWEFSITAGASWNSIANTTNLQSYLNLTQTTYYRAVIQNGVCAAVNSTNAIITVNPLPAITPAPAAVAVCFKSTSQTTTLAYSAAVNSPNQYSISWNAVPTNSFAAVTNVALPVSPITITVPANTAAGTYTGTISVRNTTTGCIGAGVSFTITVNPLPTNTALPASQTICSGDNISGIVLSNSNAVSGVLYTWSRTTPAGISGTVANSGTNVADGTVINGLFSNANTTATTVTFTINSASPAGCAGVAATATVLVNAPVTITTQPTSTTVCAGQSASFTLAATGTGLTYQWKKGTTNLINGGSISGATSATLTINPAAAGDNATDYNCVVTSGSCSSAISNYTTLTVNAVATAPVAQPTALIFPTVNTTSILATFNLSASATNYLVIRKAVNVAPTNPVNGTTYVAGSAALGGFVDYAGTGNVFTSNGLSPNTTYYYWVYAYNTSPCGTSPLYLVASPLTGSVLTASTIACGTVTTLYWGGRGSVLTGGITNGTNFNTASNWSTTSPAYTASPVIPTQCNNVSIALNADVTITLSADAAVYNMTYTVNGNGDQTMLSVEGRKLVVNGNANIDVLGGDDNTEIAIGENSNGSGLVDFKANVKIGENVNGDADFPKAILVGNVNSKVIFRGDVLLGRFAAFNYPATLPPGTGTTPGTIEFDGIGLQQILWNNNVWYDNFYNVVVGNQNAPYVRHVTGTYTPDNILNNLTINNGATVDLATSQWIRETQGGVLSLNGTASLILGNDKSVKSSFGSGIVVAGSNFPGGFSTMNISPTSTVEYNGASGITQTVFGTPSVGSLTYGNLTLSNGPNTGIANKNSTSTITVVGATNINDKTTMTLGAGLVSNTVNGTAFVNAGGTLMCGTNVVSGTGSFTLNANGTLGMGLAAGITSAGATGNVQTAIRSFGTASNYIYNGTVAQGSGNGLPYTVNDLTVLNTLGLSMNPASRNYTIAGTLILTSGSLNINGDSITINKLQRNSGTLGGSSTSSVGITGNSIPLFFTGGSQVLRNLFLQTNATADLQTALDITAGAGAGSVSVGAGATLTTFNRLTLKSDNLGTARVAQIPVDGSGNALGFITGNVRIERFIPAQRAWRMLTVPIKSVGAPTFNAAWQEGVVNTDFVFGNNKNPNPGFGMHISGSSAALGFDPTPQNNPSIKLYNPANDTWAGIPNTLTARVSDSSGYMVFVRGNRSTQLSLNTAAPLSTTVLRASGQLKTGLQNFNIPATLGAYAIVGNPFASTIDFKQVSASPNISDGFVLWDPKLTGIFTVGAYQYFTKMGSDYVVFPGGGSYGAALSINNTIQSGQAILVQHAGSGTLAVNENAKVSGSSSAMFRPTTVPMPAYVGAFVHYLEPDSSTYLADGALVMFDDRFNAGIDKEDFKKASNISENLSVVSHDELLAVEKRQTVAVNDTIFYKFSKLKLRKYRFVFSVTNMNAAGLTAILEDTYLNVKQPLDMAGETPYDFIVTNDSGAWNPYRFRVVFKSSGALPVTFTTISANSIRSNIVVKWNVANEIAVDHYEVEKSLNGSNFNFMATVIASGNNSAGIISYDALDVQPNVGDNFYRVKSVDRDGRSAYSNIVKVNVTNGVRQVSIYPNPVKDGHINLQMEHMPSGEYQARVINQLGQILQKKTFVHTSETTIETLLLHQQLLPGQYHIELLQPDNSSTMLNFIKQ